MTNAVRLPTMSSLLDVPQRLVISCYMCRREASASVSS